MQILQYGKEKYDARWEIFTDEKRVVKDFVETLPINGRTFIIPQDLGLMKLLDRATNKFSVRHYLMGVTYAKCQVPFQEKYLRNGMKHEHTPRTAL
jgi:hypothetical protein